MPSTSGRPSDWRVQVEFGGSAELVAVGDVLAAASRKAIDAAQPTPLYARINLAEAVSGELQVIELELVEPELFFRFGPHVATRMAELLTHGKLRRDRTPRDVKSPAPIVIIERRPIIAGRHARTA